MQGSFYGEIPMSDDYVAVEAYSVESRASSGSGTDGSYFQGIRINWTTESDPGGVTNSGWYTGDPNSPFFGQDETTLVAAIESAGNADAYFSAWVASDVSHKSFISGIPEACWDLVRA